MKYRLIFFSVRDVMHIWRSLYQPVHYEFDTSCCHFCAERPYLSEGVVQTGFLEPERGQHNIQRETASARYLFHIIDKLPKLVSEIRQCQDQTGVCIAGRFAHVVFFSPLFC